MGYQRSGTLQNSDGAAIVQVKKNDLERQFEETIDLHEKSKSTKFKIIISDIEEM